MGWKYIAAAVTAATAAGAFLLYPWPDPPARVMAVPAQSLHHNLPAVWPCGAVVTVRVNPAGAPAGFDQTLASALSEINAATGLRMRRGPDTTVTVSSEQDPGPDAQPAGTVLLSFDTAAGGPSTLLTNLGVVGTGGHTVTFSNYGRLGWLPGSNDMVGADVVLAPVPGTSLGTVLAAQLAHVAGMGVAADGVDSVTRATSLGYRDADLVALSDLYGSC